MQKLIDSHNFIFDLQKELYSSEVNKVVFIMFKISYGELFKRIYSILLMLLDLNVEVELYLDALFTKYSFDGFHKSFFRLRKNHKHKTILINEALDNLVDKGARIKFFNEKNDFINKNILTFCGRDHRKFIYIRKKTQQSLVYFGAMNLNRFDTNDYMIKSTNTELNELLLEKNLYIWNNPWKENIEINLEDFGMKNSKIIIDGGLRESKIYLEALSLINKAKEKIIFVSQLPPEPHLILHLVKAKLRNIKNILVLIPDIKHKKMKKMYIYLAFFFAKLVSKIFNFQIKFVSKGYTHAKILICDNFILLGSHNLSFVGVMAGTIEMSMFTNDKTLYESTINFVNNL